MKPFKTCFILLATIALLWSACKKSNTSPQNNISFSLKGHNYSVPNPTVTQTNASLAMFGKWGVTVAGINITDPTVGSFDMSQYLAIVTLGTGDSVYQSNAGLLWITAIDNNHVSGTFQGTAKHYPDTTQVPVQGTFNVSLK